MCFVILREGNVICIISQNYFRGIGHLVEPEFHEPHFVKLYSYALKYFSRDSLLLPIDNIDSWIWHWNLREASGFYQIRVNFILLTLFLICQLESYLQGNHLSLAPRLYRISPRKKILAKWLAILYSLTSHSSLSLGTSGADKVYIMGKGLGRLLPSLKVTG